MRPKGAATPRTRARSKRRAKRNTTAAKETPSRSRPEKPGAQQLRRIRLAELLNAEARHRGMDVQDLAMQLSGISPKELAELQAERHKSVAAAIGVDHLL
ncbi:DUF6388 family protein [Bordetella genomosp. 1]|uniref:DUF6388 family protein n=1 Tax=Bordetella genomosp. 1 TaxID=1395607 RepID=UPI0034E87C39